MVITMPEIDRMDDLYENAKTAVKFARMNDIGGMLQYLHVFSILMYDITRDVDRGVLPKPMRLAAMSMMTDVHTKIEDILMSGRTPGVGGY